MPKRGLALEGTIRHRTLGVCGQLRLDLDTELFDRGDQERLQHLMQVFVHEVFNRPTSPAGIVIAEVVHFRTVNLPRMELIEEPPKKPSPFKGKRRGKNNRGADEPEL